MKSAVASKVVESNKIVDPCDDCQKLFNSAQKKQNSGVEAKNTFQSLVELCKLNHNGKKHKDLVTKCIDFIVNQLQSSETLGELLNFYLKCFIFLKVKCIGI